jgi:CRISPR-associated protein Cas2
MDDEQFVVVAYDISNDRRRTRLHDRLEDFGTPVQYSVFECLLDAESLRRMKQAVRKIIRPRLDHVRYYILCANCRAKIEVTGRREVTQREEVLVAG